MEINKRETRDAREKANYQDQGLIASIKQNKIDAF